MRILSNAFRNLRGTQAYLKPCLFVKKMNNLQVQIDINLKTVNRFKYKMDYSIVNIVSMCIE